MVEWTENKEDYLKEQFKIIIESYPKHFRMAVVPYELLENNPCDNIKAPSPSKPDIDPFTKEDTDKILNSIDDFFFYSIIYVDLYTGLRRGEILALKWKNIDFKNDFNKNKLVGLTGLEPVACRLGIYRSIQLSYSPSIFSL